MRAVAILLMTLICRVSAAGSLYETTEWNYDDPPKRTGAVAFDDILALGLNTNGAWIAYVDLLGTAESLTLYSQVPTDTGLRSPISPNSWLHAIASAPKKEVTDDGWSRFDFRDLRLFVTDIGGGYPNFIDGGGPYFGATNGVFNAYDRYFQDARFNVIYWEMPSGEMPIGPYPMFRVVWETVPEPSSCLLMMSALLLIPVTRRVAR